MTIKNPSLIPTVDDFDTFEDFSKYGEMFWMPPLKNESIVLYNPKGTDIVPK